MFVGRVLRCTVAAANFTMESELLFNRTGSLYFCTTVYRKEGPRILSRNTGTWCLLDKKTGGQQKMFTTMANAASSAPSPAAVLSSKTFKTTDSEQG